MAFTSVLNSIRSASDDVELRLKLAPSYDNELLKRLGIKLRNLTTFVLSARWLGGARNVTCFLDRIEDTARRYAERFHTASELFRFHDLDKLVASEFEKEIDFFKDEIDGWYDTMLNSSTRQSTTDHEVLEMFSSILENLVDFRCLIMWRQGKKVPLDTMEAFEQHTSFLNALIRFVSKRSVGEGLLDFLAHSQTVAVHSAYLLFRFGSVEFYLSSDCENMQSEMLVLLQKIKPIDSHVYLTYTRALTSSKMNRQLLDDDDVFSVNKDFLESLISDLWNLLRLNPSLVSVKDLKKVYAGLRSLRTDFKQHQETEEGVGDVLCSAGVLICSLRHHIHSDETNLVLKHFLDKIRPILVQLGAAKVTKLSTGIMKAEFPSDNEEEEETGVKEVTLSYETKIPSQETGFTSATNEQVFVGLHDGQRLFVDQLTRGSRRLKIVAIVGMPGLGKTTLATRVYANTSVRHYFSVRAWSSISQVLDKRKVVLDLLNQINPRKCSDQDLADTLRKSLKGRKYLIFLDDMWDIEAWNVLKESFPDDNVGSRIILTSRRQDVAPHDLMVDGKPHLLRQLNEEESMELLQRRLSYGLSPDVGRKISQKCRGLPLLIIILAGVLKPLDPESWNGLLGGLRNVSSIDTHCKNTLELSYQHLPSYLRPCLLYFAVFQEDEEVTVRRLLRLWIAEGFVRKDDDGMRSLDDAAEGYLKDLIGRSLLMIAKQRSDDGIKTCRIHDLLHDFCIQKAKDERFFHFLKGGDELLAFNEVESLQRLCIRSEAKHFKQSKLFCPHARSLIFNSSQSESTQKWCEVVHWVDISPMIQTFKLLTVLDLEQVDLGLGFPTEIEQLVQLTFLAIRCYVMEIPSMIGSLVNLGTFIMECGTGLTASFPRSFWNLRKLEYLYIKSRFGGGGFRFPEIDIEGSFSLHELDSLSGAVILLSEMESLLRKFSNIRKLKFTLSCWVDFDEDGCNNTLVLEFLSRLESLHMLYKSINMENPVVFTFGEFILPAHLKKLTLGKFKLSQRNLSTIGELQNLQVLKLIWVEIEGGTWEMKEGEFPKLKFLKMAHLRLVRWVTECYDQLECFQKLVLENCWYLEEMPSCLDYISTFEVIEVTRCDYRVVNLVKLIDERRKDLMGDSGLKIITSNVW